MREETKVGLPKDNPFCNNCKEKHCCVSLDGTCAMIRVYLLRGKMSNMCELCKDKLAIGDDFGDNTCTFVCGLQKDHPGKCREVFTSDGREDIVIEWNKR